jgi:DinB superfamily
MMDMTWKTILWRELGASIDMLENAILACPDEVWGERLHNSEYWYITYHTLFWLDCYLSEGLEGFMPPAPYTLDEFDPAGTLPNTVYSKDELHRYLLHCRKKCQTTLFNLTDEKARQHFRGNWEDMTIAELMLDNIRHVQHHTAQLNLLLRQRIDSAPQYVTRTKEGLRLAVIEENSK